MPCLGDFVGHNGVRLDPDKVKIGPLYDHIKANGLLNVLISPKSNCEALKNSNADYRLHLMDSSNLAIGARCLKTREGWEIQLLVLVFGTKAYSQSCMPKRYDTINKRIARLFNDLAKFQLLLKWIPGETNTLADSLSRKPAFKHNAARVILKELLKSAQNRVIVSIMVACKMTVSQSAKQM
ncbi:hypothetical protein PHMEG_00019608 [Phytophthora megakarya]|uniref:Reverse transcriptase RNase H-like domain-containing protein n=1 Tax=Phytophthora megakarya TaxID=4795 RepID=A0A225VSP4_9STRA|nr:hypothetical protein PHMEG_00019608 [Phytophthora megakarya]